MELIAAKLHYRFEQLLLELDWDPSWNHREESLSRYHADSSNCMIFRTQELTKKVFTCEVGLFENKLLDDLQFFFSTTFINNKLPPSRIKI